MAGPVCNNHPQVPASFIGTFLTTGDTIAVCDECLVAFTAAILNQMTGVDPAPFLQAVSDDGPPDASLEVVDPSTAYAEAPEGKPPARSNGRRGRTPAASPEAGMETDPDAEGPATQTTADIPAA